MAAVNGTLAHRRVTVPEDGVERIGRNKCQMNKEAVELSELDHLRRAPGNALMVLTGR